MSSSHPSILIGVEEEGWPAELAPVEEFGSGISESTTEERRELVALLRLLAFFRSILLGLRLGLGFP